QLPNVQIDTLQRNSDNYSRLYQTIKAQWQEVFFDKELTEPEVQLLLLYFANEYTNRSYQRGLRALVVCENGFSTSQILKSRLLKEVPEIQQIATSKVSQLDQINPREYDLILSTLELPGFPREYQVVSPLLLENDVAKIRNWLNSYQKKFTVDSVPTDTRKTEQLADPQILAHKAEQITLYNRIVTSCSVTSLPNTSETLSELTQAIVAQISNKYISQPDSVISGLLSRAELAPIGIPDTNLALLHTSNQGVKQPFFAIFELSSPLTLRAMDQEPIAVKRLVVLLAPEKINHLTESTLGMISSLMIMNDENTALFQTASTKQLRSFLTQKFLDEIRK
ncbi:PTS sugar transporter subunit IIA, partial [Ligilactobacillus salitolerans]|uniref:PTS sugar transporter subunit IIA n=1 Tax=Ligilactobacillus salitolerans TaxID=1808352 RepID=UPI0013152718